MFIQIFGNLKENKNRKIVAQCWAGISASGPTLLAWSNGRYDLLAHTSRRGGVCMCGHRARHMWAGAVAVSELGDEE
jgi:hypothetical protein